MTTTFTHSMLSGLHQMEHRSGFVCPKAVASVAADYRRWSITTNVANRPATKAIARGSGED